MRLKWEHGRVKRSTPASSSASSSSSSSTLSKPATVPAPHPGHKTHPLSRIQPNASLNSPSSALTALAARPILDPPLPVLPGHRNGMDVFLLQHYFFTVSSLLSSTPDRSVNTYVSTILPLMLEHECLLNTVLALSAVHLGSRFPGSFSVYGEKLKGDGMRGLIQRLDQCREQQQWDDGVLATIIMFGLLEVFDANASLWSRHLQGAGSLLAAHLERAAATTTTTTTTTTTPSALVTLCGNLTSPTWRKLLDIYAYHEVLAAISLRRAPRLPSSFLSAARKPPESQLSSQWPEDEGGAGHGEGQWSAFAGQPLKQSVFLSAVDSLLSLVAELARIRSSCPAPSESEEARRHTAVVAHRLRLWRCPAGVGYSDETCNTAEAMRQAGLLFYHLAFAGMELRADVQLEARVEEARFESEQAVRTIIACLGAISPAHSVVASHIWPLYMAGVAASDEGQRMFIRNRLDDMARVRGMKSIVQVRETLGQVWAGRGTAVTEMAIGDSLGDDLGGLVLF
ncbi:hypothetical protein SCUCBS95973_006435 [Sporothrix curviconia]|uniref:Uncharacterized protein n=1 Tax=Sporothrix curviconia TaxID=1260050 RepID=A0ABP0C7J0_9PEZI